MVQWFEHVDTGLLLSGPLSLLSHIVICKTACKARIHQKQKRRPSSRCRPPGGQNRWGARAASAFITPSKALLPPPLSSFTRTWCPLSRSSLRAKSDFQRGVTIPLFTGSKSGFRIAKRQKIRLQIHIRAQNITPL